MYPIDKIYKIVESFDSKNGTNKDSSVDTTNTVTFKKLYEHISRMFPNVNLRSNDDKLKNAAVNR